MDRKLAMLAHLVNQFEAHLDAFLKGLDVQSELLRAALSGGHRTRPVCTMLACAAAGGVPAAALDFALGIELTHKASVLRDDVADDDHRRDGADSFHVRHGVVTTLAVSDVLWAASLDVVRSCHAGALGDTLTTLLVRTHREMAVGQLQDVSPELDFRGITSGDRLAGAFAVNQLKTASLVAAAFGGGARCAGGAPRIVAALTQFGEKMGSAFQLLNDIANLHGSGSHLDRRGVNNTDIRSGRRGVLVEYAVQHLAPQRVRELESLLAGGAQLQENEVLRARQLVLDSGASDYARSASERFLSDAREIVSQLPDSDATQVLAGFCDLGFMRTLVL